MQRPGCEEGAHLLGAIGCLQIAARGGKRLAEEGGQPLEPALPGFLRDELERCCGPQLAAEQAEDEAGIAAEAAHLALEGRPVAGGKSVEMRDVARPVHAEDRVAPVGAEYARRRRAMGEFEPACLEVLAERRKGRRGDEQHHGGGHHIVHEAGAGDLFGAEAAADHRVAFEQQDLAALLPEHGGRHEGIDAAADDDVVIGCRRSVHARTSPWLAASGADGIGPKGRRDDRQRPRQDQADRSRAPRRSRGKWRAAVLPD